ncbi:MAG: hypothetical protein FWG91_05700 [Lachnospiraceae bacterium]|nr:hypothetical protein [Lachnospiraceae bacterium]
MYEEIKESHEEILEVHYEEILREGHSPEDVGLEQQVAIEEMLEAEAVSPSSFQGIEALNIGYLGDVGTHEMLETYLNGIYNTVDGFYMMVWQLEYDQLKHGDFVSQLESLKSDNYYMHVETVERLETLEWQIHDLNNLGIMGLVSSGLLFGSLLVAMLMRYIKHE